MELELLGVSKAKQNQFAVKGIYTVQDLLQYLPRDYKDYRKITGILPADQVSVMRVLVKGVKLSYSGTKDITIATCLEQKSGNTIRVLWFNCSWIYKKIQYMVNTQALLIGKVELDQSWGYQVSHPEIFEQGEKYLRIYPVYRAIPRMSADYLQKTMAGAISAGALSSEMLPADIVDAANVLPMPRALKCIHNPSTMEEIREGQERILFNDLVYFAVRNEISRTSLSPGSQYNIRTKALAQKIIRSLPYQLTEDQDRVVNEMIADAEQGRRINALIQADVGAGKTICAALMAAAFIGNGYQAVLMAPTQVLARQHYENLSSMFAPFNINVVYLDSTLKSAEKKSVLKSIKNGEAQMIIGTHSCSGKGVEYNDLALTIVDEEHRFGVQQRTSIIEKGSRGVHSITMSATPIPRSLASVIYGDQIQLHTIRSMPAGRKPVITGVAEDQGKVFRFILKQIRQGHQIYVVCPMIDQNESLPDVKSVEEVYEGYCSALGPLGVKIESLTGKNTPEETEEIIGRFQNRETDILISTTVVEVGVDVKNATVMVIPNAERFGLSSLHQLRGRVGRSQQQSYCILQSSDHSEKALARLRIMCDTTDGFKIAEADLKQRGAGDLLGTQQAGSNKYAELVLAYPEKYDYARKIAKDLIDRGPNCCPMMQHIVEEMQENSFLYGK